MQPAARARIRRAWKRPARSKRAQCEKHARMRYAVRYGGSKSGPTALGEKLHTADPGNGEKRAQGEGPAGQHTSAAAAENRVSQISCRAQSRASSDWTRHRSFGLRAVGRADDVACCLLAVRRTRRGQWPLCALCCVQVDGSASWVSARWHASTSPSASARPRRLRVQGTPGTLSTLGTREQRIERRAKQQRHA